MRCASRLVILAAASVLVAGAAVQACDSEFDLAGEPLACTIEESYEGWGFTIDIPMHLKACDAWSRAVVIPLGEGRYVVAEGIDNVDSISSIDGEALAASFLDSGELRAVRLESQGKTWLGLARAVRLELGYVDAEGRSMVIVFITALSGPLVGDPEAPRFRVSLSLTTTREHYLEDLRTLEQIRRSWVELEDEGCCRNSGADAPLIAASR